MSVTEEQGQAAVRTARAVIDGLTLDPAAPSPTAPADPLFTTSGGVFVTINRYPGRHLRGCIGYPLPRQSIGTALVQAARSACHDPRFPVLRAEELEGIIVEVSFLTPPRPMVGPARQRPAAITVGREGLIVSDGLNAGLLLPQVAVEQGWDARTFLGHACLKAGLPAPAWENPATRVEVFEAHVWSETTPRGDVVRVFP